MRSVALFLLLSTPALAQPVETPAREIVARAFEAMGGKEWAQARSLLLTGRAVFYAPDSAAPRTVADDYRMWRLFEEDRADAHAEAGMVRIVARVKGKTLFEIASDGAVSWNQNGVIPAEKAAETWANNFGFGVIRHALKPGFTLTRLPDDNVLGDAVHMVRVTDPAGTVTLFGIDQRTHRVRLAGFLTPKGWHVRTYADFFMVGPWVQPGKVTLYYNGVKQNEVIWERAVVNPPLDAALFKPGAALPAR
ncbi:hypothetical protein [Sandaracinobacteroides saxicola]|uniref:Outer membrane lipoprotein-sorting protein n=1 Tax=Sandaracinobacteroides saxicola TaxID=2759707 RepID=A0A7G5IF21_9SPHN|nr:hypothetical protein [Sandaracinobacteroides saxicola]QMW21963.1 hypothetical protein H3309_11300 [Sandaracinobacteroides saxicola]